MSSPENRSSADRNLLFGILAVQVNFIDRDALVAAMNAWVLEKEKPLGQILIEQRKMTLEQLKAIDTLIEQHLKLHGDNPTLSLRATGVRPSDLNLIKDVDLQASIAKLRPALGGDETATYRPSPSEEARYRKLRFHADGGQGRVFVANDSELHREVALKENKPEYATDTDYRLRLVLEAEITGGLEHPGIVPVYGLGTYPDGRPYYAMRFIRGDNLDAAIQQFHAADKPGRDVGERSLAFRQLLRRFVDVCNAVAYAHSRGVVHRDLKPKNVMLGKFGETLVVDWGLAKVGTKDQSSGGAVSDLEAERTLRPASGSSVEATLDGAQIGTPPFMSPEQADGRVLELGSGSDIYSLGSSLFVLLTGRMPYEAPTRDEILEKVRGGQFTPPKQVKPETPAALDAICRKAMSLQPKDRYESALAFATDIEHWLADEPVGVFPEPWTTRVGRWARRHRAAVAIALVFLFFAVAGLAVSTALISAEQRRTAEQERRAENNYRLAREQVFRLINLMESSEAEFTSSTKLQTTRKDILDSAAHACREFLNRRSDDPELSQRSAQVFRYAANVHRSLFDVESADSLYQESISLYSQCAQQQPKETAYQAALSEVLRDYAKLQSSAGHLKEATTTLSRSIETAEKLLPASRRALATSLLNRSVVEFTCGHFDTSLADADRAEIVFSELLNEPVSQGHPYDRVLFASVLNVQAAVARETGDFEKAGQLHAKAIEQMTSASKQGGLSNVDVRHFMASFRLEQCRTYSKVPKKQAVAEKNLTLILGEWETLSKALPKIPLYRESLGVAHRLLGELRMETGERFDQARLDLEKSRDLLAKVVEESPTKPSARGELGRTYLVLGHLAKRQQSPTDEYYGIAVVELKRASALAPGDLFIRRDLEEANATQQH